MHLDVVAHSEKYSLDEPKWCTNAEIKIPPAVQLECEQEWRKYQGLCGEITEWAGKSCKIVAKVKIEIEGK